MKEISSSLCKILLGSVNNGFQQVVDQFNASSIFIICDENTHQHCVPALIDLIPNSKLIITSSGERNKNIASCQSIWSSLINYGADRHSLVINLGGGVICDMGGFAAACYQRGISFAHVPTTLMAMSDAAIGGKLGVDYDEYKNYLGLIKQPSFIWIDPDFLATLPEMEFISGLAEVIKHAIIGSEKLWSVLSRSETIATLSWNDIIEESIAVKVKIVDKDPLENGARKVLNFGHTIGHALESFYLSKSREMKHGHCVALGMLAESRIALLEGALDSADFEAITSTIDRFINTGKQELPEAEAIMKWIKVDKKNRNGRPLFSLPDKIGSCRCDIPVEEGRITEALNWLRAHVNSVPFRLTMDKQE